MKKVWNAPDMQELTIQSTAFGYGNKGYGQNFGGGHGGHGGPGSHGGHGGSDSHGGSNICRCQGGTSPCEFHHWGEDDPS